MTQTNKSIAAFGMTDAELETLLRKMEAITPSRAAQNRRKHLRHLHICKNVKIEVVQPGGGSTSRVVVGRDLSAGGMAILYPGYLYNGSQANVLLQKRQGGVESVRGQIRNCRHIHGPWHAVGIKFDDCIYPQLFLSADVKNQVEEADPPKVDVAKLKGSVLLIDDQTMDRNLFVHLLKGSSLRVTEAATADEALSLVGRASAATGGAVDSNGAYDLVVCDLNLGPVPGEITIAQIREKGHKGPLVIMTAETGPDRLSAAMAAGGTLLLQKPYSPEKLHGAIASSLGESCRIIDDPIHSPLCSDPQNQPMVEKYVTQVRATATELHKLIGEENLPQIRLICQTFKGTGSGYGFQAMTDAAAAAMVSLDASCSVEESITDLRRLELICGRISAAEPPAQPGKNRKRR